MLTTKTKARVRVEQSDPAYDHLSPEAKEVMNRLLGREPIIVD